MKIGILKCDNVIEELLPIEGEYEDMFIARFQAINSAVEFTVYDVTKQEFPSTIKENDCYLITGSKFSCYDDEEWIRKVEQFIKDCHTEKHVLIGICFGHQLIAQTLGGKVGLSDKGWGIGLHTVSFAIQKPWMAQNDFTIYYSHKDQVMTLPTGSTLIGSSEHCQNAAYQIGIHILCFQGHPEFSRAYAKALVARKDIDTSVLKRADFSKEGDDLFSMMLGFIQK